MNMHPHFWWRGEAGFKMYMPVYNCMKNRFLLVEVYVLSIIIRLPPCPRQSGQCVSWHVPCVLVWVTCHQGQYSVLSTAGLGNRYIIMTSADEELFRLLHRQWWTTGYIYPLLRGLRGDAPMLPCHLPPGTYSHAVMQCSMQSSCRI